jgi:inositol polyphosphate 5-phosphatase INPP5J/K
MDRMNFSSNVSFSSYIFWFGDLNFRLTGHDTPEKVRDDVKNNKLKELMELDQLRLVMKDGRAFKTMEERVPEFPPTFKFKPGTSEYDMK